MHCEKVKNVNITEFSNPSKLQNAKTQIAKIMLEIQPLQLCLSRRQWFYILLWNSTRQYTALSNLPLSGITQSIPDMLKNIICGALVSWNTTFILVDENKFPSFKPNNHILRFYLSLRTLSGPFNL